MTTWFDYVSLIIISALYVGVIYGSVVVPKKISEWLRDTKQKLKSQGYYITPYGIVLKTSSHYTRERYLDDVQRQFISIGKKMAKASSVNRRASIDTDSTGSWSPASSRQSSLSSTSEAEFVSAWKKLKIRRTK